MKLRYGIAACVLVLAVAGAAKAAERMRFWNLTSVTIKELYLAPAGTTQWSANQCKNDPDGTVDHDERLRITGVGPGRYDAKFTDKIGRTCVVRNVELKDGAVFSIEEKELTDCKN